MYFNEKTLVLFQSNEKCLGKKLIQTREKTIQFSLLNLQSIEYANHFKEMVTVNL